MVTSRATLGDSYRRRHALAVIILGMILQGVVRVSAEELRKAMRGALAVYEMVREADERALKMLLTFLGIG